MLDKYTLAGGISLTQYGTRFLAAHFRDPVDYVRRPQTSAPDHKPYHGLESETGDRLVWTIEVRVHGDVPVPPKRPLRVVLQGKDLLDELPKPYRRLASAASRGDSFGFHQAITKDVLKLMEVDG